MVAHLAIDAGYEGGRMVAAFLTRQARRQWPQTINQRADAATAFPGRTQDN